MMRLAKIVATLGPASQDPESIEKLMKSGVNVFRLNFSHGQHDVLTKVIADIRALSKTLSLPIAILGDLQGPKFRIGELKEHRPIFLEKGNTIRFTAESTPGDESHITTNTPQIIEAIRPGDEILLDDGLIALKVTEKPSSKEVICQILEGGVLGEKKGVNVPGLKMTNVPSMTEKDKTDALFIIEQELDFIALSFVRNHKDILDLRHFLDEHTPHGRPQPNIVAKIEKPQALDDIDAIIAATDALMVARGDLGVEMKLERVPVIQKMLIEKCNVAEKPVITATQMLESMIHHPTPTRAEVSDVANAVFDGSDALMLSGETAMGKFPVESVQVMSRIIVEAESHFQAWNRRTELEEFVEDVTSSSKPLKFHQAIAQAACFASMKAQTKAIVVLSYSGRMALRISKRKPQRPILAMTPHQSVYRKMNLFWGVYPLKVVASETTEGILREAEDVILRRGFLALGDPIVFCAGQTHLAGVTNTIKIYNLGAAEDHE